MTARWPGRLTRVALALGMTLALGATPAQAVRAERCVAASLMPGGSPASAAAEPIDRQDARARALREQARRLADELLAHPLIGPVERMRDKLAALGYDAGQPLERYLLAARLDTGDGRERDVVRAEKLTGAVRAFVRRQPPVLALSGLVVKPGTIDGLMLLDVFARPLEAALDAELAHRVAPSAPAAPDTQGCAL
ncbi:MAG TPA: hypothetical protein VHT71_01660 [Methylomirabilota bacterium]|nr:hypothetical protein [Methylomirabilota bacterium]